MARKDFSISFLALATLKTLNNHICVLFFWNLFIVLIGSYETKCDKGRLLCACADRCL